MPIFDLFLTPEPEPEDEGGEVYDFTMAGHIVPGASASLDGSVTYNNVEFNEDGDVVITTSEGYTFTRDPEDLIFNPK